MPTCYLTLVLSELKTESRKYLLQGQGEGIFNLFLTTPHCFLFVKNRTITFFYEANKELRTICTENEILS